MDAPPPYGGQITTQSITLYGAYGLSDHLDLIVNLPYVTAMGNADDNMVDQSVGNIQDLSLFLEWNPLSVEAGNGLLAFVGALGVSTPLSDYVADAVLSIGNQATRLDGRLLMQYKAESGFFCQPSSRLFLPHQRCAQCYPPGRQARFCRFQILY